MQTIRVPVSLLLDPDHTASTTVIWMTRCLHPAAGPVELATRTGLSRNTNPAGMRQAAGLTPASGAARVKVPGAQLAERSVGATAKVLYGLLQVVPGFRGQNVHICAPTRVNRCSIGDRDRPICGFWGHNSTQTGVSVPR